MASIIEFNLLAPYNEKAALISSFSDWQDVAMQKGEDGYFRTSIKLADGQYQYKFRVQTKPESPQAGAWVMINDPYVTAIDRHTGNGVVWIKDGQRIVDPYVWQHDEQPLPQNHELVIYELLVSDFYRAENGNRRGQFRDVIQKLDYLQDLGINAIELLPINESPGDYNWGYIPSYFFAPQANYGTTAELKQLIDECHARGIRVFLDQIYNHSSEDSPLLHIDRNYWYYPDRHHPDAPSSDYWGPEFNYEHYDENLNLQPARAFMGDVMKFWICEYHIDGIRFDALKQIDNRDFLQWMTQLAQATTAAKPLFTIGEHIPEDPGLVRPNGPMDSCWHENFYYQVVPHLQDEKFDLEALKAALNPSQQGYPSGVTKAVIYLCNHDRQRLMLALGEHEILDEMAFERSRLGAVLLMTAVGIPLI